MWIEHQIPGPVEPHHEKCPIQIQINLGLGLQIWVSWLAGAPLTANMENLIGIQRMLTVQF